MVKLKISKQTTYKLINKALDAEIKFDELRLHVEYAPSVFKFLDRYADDDQFDQLKQQYSGASGDDSFLLVAKLPPKMDDLSDIAYSVNRKYNTAISGFGGDQLHVTENDIAFLVDAGAATFALIPFDAN